MTRRITIAVVAAVTVALLLAGVGTVVLAGSAARADARERLEEQADDAAALLAFVGNRVPDALPALRRTLQVDGIEVARLDLSLADRLPGGVVLDAGDVAALRRGEPVSVADGADVVALAVIPRRAPAQVVVVEADVPLLDRALVQWVAVASLATLAVALVVGSVVARRATRPLREVDGAARRIAAGDLSARVEVPRRTDELAELARSVNAMTESLARSEALSRSFLLSISHDLRTPLTSIRGYAEALEDGTVADSGRAAGVIVREARRLERLVADLLELARLDAREFSLEPVAADIAEVVQDAADAFRPAFESEGVELEVVVPDSLDATLDPDRIGQIVANLVENALKHARSLVMVTGSATGDDAVRIVVADDGAGVPADERHRVFERLYTGREPARRNVGTGLGLAIVAELVTAMGGTVRCDDVEGGGAAFVVDVPGSQSKPRSS